MKNMKKANLFALLLLFFLINGVGYAQQFPLYTQYMQNDFLLNPAIAGTKNYAPFTSIIRSQWMGISDNPKTQSLSFHSSLKNQKMGVGGYLFNDKIGPILKTGISGSYAYRLKFSNETHLSFGLSALIYYYKIRTDKMQFDDQTNTDNVLSTGVFRAFYPNFSFGTYYYGEKYYVGISIPELMQTKVSSTPDFSVIKLKRHYHLAGGYKIAINDDYMIEPSMLIKYVSGAPVELDINARFEAYKKFNLGVSYRTNDAVAILLGYTFGEKFHFGYSYDITTSGLKGYTKGTHEIMLRYDLFKKGESPSSF